MVDFWYNHFNVFAGKGIDRALVASYERDAIRPYALGSFRDLLGATAKHPAMLFYLDNWSPSTPGPAATAEGQGQARPERELRARADGAAHAGRGRRLHPAGRDRAGAHADRLDLRPAPPGALQRDLPLRRRPPRPAAPRPGSGHEVAPAGQARRRVRARRAGHAPGHRAPHQLPAGPVLRQRRRRRRPWSSAWRRPGWPAGGDIRAVLQDPVRQQPSSCDRGRRRQVQDALPVRGVGRARQRRAAVATSARW